MEREPERKPETQADLNEAPQEELPAGPPLSPSGSDPEPLMTQPGAPRAEEVAGAQVRAARAPDLSAVIEEPEQLLGMLLKEDLRDNEGHLLLARGQMVTASALAEIEAAGCLEELARVVRPELPEVAPWGME